MTTSLYWKPISTDEYGVSDHLRNILRKHCDQVCVFTTLDQSDISYLQGLADAGIADATNLMAAIREYGEIQLFEQ